MPEQSTTLPRANPETSAFLAGGVPAIIAGPCSAESEAQLVATAQGLQAAGITRFRMGVWKPRTRPNSFEGVGKRAFEWLPAVRAVGDFRIATEVANAKMAEAALLAGVDILWIGARTTVNPFTVQEIAEALRGAHVPVMVKNPVNPDLGLWIGALERFHLAGITDLAACHRGFTYFGRHRLRNAPQWEIPLELRRLHPDLPLFSDPSHIAGKRSLIREISQQALDLGYDGLMIESHSAPETALSDAAQQISPQTLADLLQSLTLRHPDAPQAAYHRELSALRSKIDEADQHLLDAISRRLEIASAIGELKSVHNVQLFQGERWREVYRSRLQTAEELGISPGFVRQFLQLLHLETIHKQRSESPSQPAADSDAAERRE